MQNLTVFNNENFGALRTIERDGEIWFVASDVAKTLGYQNGSRDINRHVRELHRNHISLNDGNQARDFIIIDEAGLYSLIMRSKLPQAEDFQEWVTSEVLPSIRKTGSYSIQQQLPQTYIEALEALVVSEKEKERLRLAKAEADAQNAVLKPKAEFNDRVLNAEGLYTITQIADDFGLTAREANNRLNEWGIQYKQSGSWHLYAQYKDLGYTMSRTIIITKTDGTEVTKVDTKWTNKGREFLVHVFEEHGYQLSSVRGNLEEGQA